MIRRSLPQNRLFFGPGAGFLLLFAGCAWMPPGGEHAEFMEPPPMEPHLVPGQPPRAGRPSQCLAGRPVVATVQKPRSRSDHGNCSETNPSLKKEYARLSETDAVAQVEGSRLLPWLDSDNAFRQLRYAQHGVVAAYNPALGGIEKTSDTFNPVSIRYEFDFWGKNRADLEAALGEATAEEAELAETRLLLTTAIARSYIGGATFAQSSR